MKYTFKISGKIPAWQMNSNYLCHLSVKKWWKMQIFFSVSKIGFSTRRVTYIITLQCCHNERDGISNHQPHDCLLNRSGADQRKYQSSLSLAFVRGIHRWPVNSPHKGPVMQKMFPFDDLFMNVVNIHLNPYNSHSMARLWGPDMGCLLRD